MLLESYLRPYLPAAIYGCIVLLTGVILLGASRLLGPRRHMVEKEDTYECGVPLLGGSRERFSVKFYLVAILFVLFDLETIFLLPWAVTYRSLGLYGLIEMLLFILILFVGYVYLLKKRALEWD